MKIDLDQIRELLTMVGQTEVTELTIEAGDQRVTIKKSAAPNNVVVQAATLPVAPPAVAAALPQALPAKAEPEAKAEPHEVLTNGLASVTSPMVGTFYRAPSPTAKPFVEVGDRISVGQTVCIIEAMKLMNDMPTEVAGRIVKICVENGTTVEYGQPLFLVDPKG